MHRKCFFRRSPPHETATAAQTDSTNTVSAGTGSSDTQTTSAVSGGTMATSSSSDPAAASEPEKMDATDAQANVADKQSAGDNVAAKPDKESTTADTNTSSPAVSNGNVKPEHVWHDVAIVKTTSLTVSHYLEKINQVDSETVDVVSIPDQVSCVAWEVIISHVLALCVAEASFGVFMHILESTAISFDCILNRLINIYDPNRSHFMLEIPKNYLLNCTYKRHYNLWAFEM